MGKNKKRHKIEKRIINGNKKRNKKGNKGNKKKGNK